MLRFHWSEAGEESNGGPRYGISRRWGRTFLLDVALHRERRKDGPEGATPGTSTESKGNANTTQNPRARPIRRCTWGFERICMAQWGRTAAGRQTEPVFLFLGRRMSPRNKARGFLQVA